MLLSMLDAAVTLSSALPTDGGLEENSLFVRGALFGIGFFLFLVATLMGMGMYFGWPIIPPCLIV